MFMICISLLERVEGQPAQPVYHGEVLIIGGTTRNNHGQENFIMPKYTDATMVWRYCENTTGECATGGNKVNPGMKKTSKNLPVSGWTGSPPSYSGKCMAFEHGRIKNEFVSQTPPFMPGYTICGHMTQLTVYLRGCCEDCLQYKTIGHCDNSATAMTQCLTIKSAYTDKIHAITSHYRLTPCNFTATTTAGGYRGPAGTEMLNTGQPKGGDVTPSEIKAWQEVTLS